MTSQTTEVTPEPERSAAFAAMATAGPPIVSPLRGSRDAAGRLRPVDEDDARCARRDVAAGVRGDRDQLPLRLGGRCGRPGDSERRGAVRGDQGAGAAAPDRAIAEGDVGRVGGGAGGEADARADRGARIVERHDGGEIVDVDRVRRGRRLVAGDVGDDDLEVCGAVGERARRERLAVRRADRRRRLRAEDREGAGAASA